MEKVVLARFKAQDGTGLWEVGPECLWVDGVPYGFTETSHIVCRAEQGRSYNTSRVVEAEDTFGLWAALAVYQETHSLEMAGLTAWALDGSSVSVEVEKCEIPGTIQLSLGGLCQGDVCDLSLRYREDGQYLQVHAVRHFADVALAAIKAYRTAHEPLSESVQQDVLATTETVKSDSAALRPKRRRRP